MSSPPPGDIVAAGVGVATITKLPSLRDASLFCLIRHRSYLGDVGDIDGASVRDICVHCNAAQLAAIEDATW